MTYENRRPDVAVFIDFENVYVSVRDKLDANPNFESIMDRCSDLGRVVLARAYADWYRYPRVTSALYANAIEPIYVATYYYDRDMGRTGRAIKNSVDMNLCIDAMKTLYTTTNIAKFVLVTGDRDFIPLVHSIRQQGKEVIIIGIGGAASTHLAQSADEFVFYEQLVGKAPPLSNMEAARTRALEASRPEPVRAPEPERVPLPVAPAPAPTPAPTAEIDIYRVLIDAIMLVRKRGYVSTLGSIKLVMKELMGGDFKESRYKDLNNRPFAKFKDFVIDAERRGKVQIYTNGTVNEVFLPGEDASKLSQFAGDFKEEVSAVEVEAPASNGRREKPVIAETVVEAPVVPAGGGRRRRRRPRGGQRHTPLVEGQELEAQLDDEGDLVPPSADELAALQELEDPAEIFNLYQEHTAEELVAAGLAAEDSVALDLYQEHTAEELVAAGLAAEDSIVLDLLGSYDPTADESEPWEAAPLVHDYVSRLGLVMVEIESVSQIELVSAEAEGGVLLASPADEFDAQHELDAAIAEDGVALMADDAPPMSQATFDLEEPQRVVEMVEAEASTAPELAEAPVQQVEDESPAAPSSAEGDDEEAEDEEAAGVLEVAFTEEEWAVFAEMMSGFAKPISFNQIFDALREVRKQKNLTRTNEQLRTMVKQAINNGMLERSGRGKRIYYRLKTDESDGE